MAGGVASRSHIRLVSAFVVAKLALHLALIGRYGYHRDEYYFIQCGKRLAFGYVDHAPLVPWLARVAGLFDHHIAALRMPSVIAGAVAIGLSMQLAREWGGGLVARAVVGTAMLAAPAYLRMGKILCIPVFEPVWWTLAALLLSRSARDGNARRWLWLGVVAGVGLMTKHSMLFWGAGAAVATLLTPVLRNQLRTPFPWLGAGIAALIFAPNLVWQLQNDWPTLEFIRAMRSGVLDAIPRPLFVGGQLIYMNPMMLPLWSIGLWVGLRQREHPGHPFAIVFVVVAGILLVLGGKPYYLAPAFPPLFVIGGLALERWLTNRVRRFSCCAMGVLALALGVSASMPLFDLRATERVMDKTLGWAVPPVALTHDLRDEHGWRELTAVVESAYASVPAERRGEIGIVAGNYGEASALRFHGDPALPRAVSGHMNYFLWGPPAAPVSSLLVLGMPDAFLTEACVAAKVVARNTAALAHPFETDLPIYYCAELKRPLGTMWASMRWYGHGARDHARAPELERH
jgi:hypothetical protein